MGWNPPLLQFKPRMWLPPSGPSAPVQVAKAGDATYMALFESIFSYQKLTEGLLATVSYQYVVTMGNPKPYQIYPRIIF